MMSQIMSNNNNKLFPIHNSYSISQYLFKTIIFMKVSMELWSKNWQEFLPAKTVYGFKHLTIGKVKL